MCVQASQHPGYYILGVFFRKSFVNKSSVEDRLTLDRYEPKRRLILTVYEA